MARFIACCLVLLSLAAFGQTPEKNLARLMEVYAVNAEDPPVELRRKIDALLKTYTDDEAYAAEAGVLQWAVKNDVVDRHEFGRGMLQIGQRYHPRDDVGLDYWRYVVMLNAKLERGEIKEEEFDYLEGRKLTEARQEADRRRVMSRPPPSVYYAPPPNEPNRIGPMLEAIGAAIKRRRPPVTTSNCVVMGNLVQCQSQ